MKFILTPAYISWQRMKDRCSNSNNPSFKYYGAKGIAVCARWKASFKDFLSDMGARPAGTSLDRINSDGNYEPGNCRWATVKEQRWNQSNIHLLSYNGETKPVSEWARVIGLSPDSLRARLRKGMSIEAALTTPRLHSLTGGMNQVAK